MNGHGKTVHYEDYHKESKTRTGQVKPYALQLEIPGKSNNATGTLNPGVPSIRHYRSQ